MKTSFILALLIGVCLRQKVAAENLYGGFIDPGFTGLTEFSQWDQFSSANLGANTPDNSAAPLNPPTLTQLVANAALLTTSGGQGWGDDSPNIYGLSKDMKFQVEDTTSYIANTVVFQFQTGGMMVDLSTIKLLANVGGVEQILSASDPAYAQYIREYTGATSGGGFGNRTAVQWDLTGLGITSYKIIFDAPAHTSFQIAALDTSNVYQEAVPELRTWTAAGGPNLSWNTGSNWMEASAPTAAGGNVRFNNQSAAEINLGGNREVGEIMFDASNVTLSGTGTLTSNTGITAKGSGTYTINSAYEIGSTNLMDIGANATVRINGSISGTFGGINKTGDGLLDLTANNTFNSSSPIAGVWVYGGTLRFGGTNTYSGPTEILFGSIIVATNVPSSGAGALGSASSNIQMGASTSEYGTAPQSGASLYIEGDRTVARNINLLGNNSDKTLGAKGTSNGAIFSGNIAVNVAPYLTLKADGEADHVKFTGSISGGTTDAAGDPTMTKVTIAGQGIVEFASTAKNYTGDTVVNAGAELRVNTTLTGAGTFDLQSAILSGTGVLEKDVTINAGDFISPGSSSLGKLTFGKTDKNQVLTFGSGGTYAWSTSNVTGVAGVNWDHLQVYGTLNVAATAGDVFTIDLEGTPAGFNSETSLYDWTLLSATEGITNFNANAFAVDTADFGAAFTGTFSVLNIGNDLVLRYIHTVPEPGRVLLLIIGVLAVFAPRKRAHPTCVVGR